MIESELATSRWSLMLEADIATQTTRSLTNELSFIVAGLRPSTKESVLHFLELIFINLKYQSKKWLYSLVICKSLIALLGRKRLSANVRKIVRFLNVIICVIGLWKGLSAMSGKNTFINGLQSYLISETALPELGSFQELSTSSLGSFRMFQQIAVGFVDALFCTRIPASLWIKYKEYTTSAETTVPQECGLCMMCVQRGDERVAITTPYTTDCGHTYCYACIMSRLKLVNNVSCPICKHRIRFALPDQTMG
ncbi:Ubiquitin-protein ligase E3 [Schizosaccharomyces pombe]|uniref:Uncharacterized RING finger protein C23A1.07 n=1 Tax=Schizosaccharomyces pombe (strain 972 / ATCC 24843) TaxID=284812 RepID=YFH7_SCHPO|nr:putative ubiquitin-protein ligase E3 [Schizosaccharomyces pombe]O42845.1 RecName: Full=Uncharacterized RING finger protein C23A1.07 [Schizosaccharomyces pombe 972h-]CAA16981.1 ubiquitin-protein ligase E3 (predicted) [Schizosaccharomyces pombe]|eukprot:NP_594437.1 putative ubiquitin-protein ligase E3 [Schizosaccharomyces pombe]